MGTVEIGDLVSYAILTDDFDGDMAMGVGYVLAYDFIPIFFYVNCIDGDADYEADDEIDEPHSVVATALGDTYEVIERAGV